LSKSKAGKPGVFSALDPSQFPGQQTFHTEAVDISTKVPESFLNRFGIYRPLGAKDPVHAVLMPGQDAGNQMPTGFGDVNPQNINSAVQNALTQPTIQEQKPRGVVGKVSEFLRGQGRAATSLVDTGLNAATGALDYAAYPLARAYYGWQMSPQEAEARAKAETTSPKDVLGRALGVTQTPEYKGEASRQVMEYIDGHINEGVDAIQQGLQQRGINIPKGDVENMVNSVLMGVAPTAGRVLKREAGYAGQAVKAVAPEPVQRAVAPIIEAVAPGTTKVQPKPAPAPGAPGAVPEAPGVEIRRNAEELNRGYQADQQAVAQGQAPQPQPGVTGTARPTTPDAPFTELKYAETGLPLNEQYALRTNVESRVGRGSPG